MSRFRSKSLQVLVATDVAARGLDVNDLTHVINYNLPDESEAYLHRTGRTGRAGKKVISLSLIHSREKGRIGNIERILGRKLTRKMVPGGHEICEKQLFSLIDKLEKIEVNESQIGPFLPDILEKLESLSREDLIKRFVSTEFNRFLEYYKNAADINLPDRDSGRGGDFREGRGERRSDERRGERRDRGERGVRSDRGERGERNDRGDRGDRGDRRSDRRSKASGDYDTFFINLGSKHKLSTLELIGMINENVHGPKVELGRIDIQRNFSFFEADSNSAKDILKGFKNALYDGISVTVDLKSGVEKPQSEGREFSKKKKARR
jgi:ATP-dependent RNA helicase DeaD